MEYCIGMRTTMYAGRKVGCGDNALLSCCLVVLLFITKALVHATIGGVQSSSRW